MKTLLAIAIGLAVAIPVAAATTKVVKSVKVDGHPFKVIWKGDQAEIERKGFLFKADAKMHVAAIKAAEQVSGCKVTNNFTPTIGLVVVTLDCTKPVE